MNNEGGLTPQNIEKMNRNCENQENPVRPLYPRSATLRPCRKTLPNPTCRISPEAVRAVDQLIDDVVSHIIELSLTAERHKELHPELLAKGMERYHCEYLVFVLSTPVHELFIASQKLNNLLNFLELNTGKGFEFENEK
jgi:hypothetical protein